MRPSWTRAFEVGEATICTETPSWTVGTRLWKSVLVGAWIFGGEGPDTLMSGDANDSGEGMFGGPGDDCFVDKQPCRPFP